MGQRHGCYHGLNLFIAVGIVLWGLGMLGIVVSIVLMLEGDVLAQTATPTLTATPSATPTATASPPPTASPTGAQPRLQASAEVIVWQGPGLEFRRVGLLQAGQTAAVTGRSEDGQWWQIRFAGLPEERAWVFAAGGTVTGAENVPVVLAPAGAVEAAFSPPPAPTATREASVMVSSVWEASYFARPDLSGAPGLVRYEDDLGADWGTAAPAYGLPADDFSVRWTRGWHFQEGRYRFRVRADGGVRLWVADTLILDHWQDGPTDLSVDYPVSQGAHTLRLEYVDSNGAARVSLRWEKIN